MIKSSTFNHLFFVYSSSVCEAHSVYLSTFLHSLFICPSNLHRLFFVIPSFFVHLPVRLAPSFVRLLFVFCSSFVRLLFVFCSSFVRLSFVICLSARAARTVPCSSYFFRYYTPSPLERAGERIFCLSFVYLPVVLRLSVVLRAHTLPSTIGIIGIIVLITDIVNISFSSP